MRHHPEVAGRLRNVAAETRDHICDLRTRDDQPGLQAGQVPRVRRRGHDEGPLTTRHLVEGGVFRAREGSVDLVADDRDIVGVRQLHHPGELLGGVHHPRRIVWGAQQVGGGMFLLERDLQGVEIQAPRLGGGDLDDASSRLVADRPERRVDRWVDDDGVAGFRGRQCHLPHARHDVAGQRHRRRIDVPAPDIGGEGRERILVVGQLRVAGVTLGDHPG